MNTIKPSILIMFHCADNAGFAIDKLKAVFTKSAQQAGYAQDQIQYSFKKVHQPDVRTHEINFFSEKHLSTFTSLLSTHHIDAILVFDMQYPSPYARVAKTRGIPVIAYWGASMSGLNRLPKLLMKKVEWLLRKRQAPDHFIFESEAMRKTATHGRGVPKNATSVVHLGVDLQQYRPEDESHYAHEQFGIPLNRKIVFYSGHMEERKGVRTIVHAANELWRQNKLDQVHFLLCGNRNDEAQTYIDDYIDGALAEHVTFAGYRNDIPALMRSCYVGVIASTGWDSFTRSSVEMLASGLPLIVSDLGGLPESTEHGKTGWHIKPGDATQLAQYICKLAGDRLLQQQFSAAARARAEGLFDESTQVASIVKLIEEKKTDVAF